ncbi:MAG: succinate dehydrogenase [Gammaproteobacteria bacterium]|nr:succinate dehydrogenase [Gammaproteobacteria bacterium]
MERSLFLTQRLTAMALGPLVLVHLGLILFAVKGGLTAEEILLRTQGSVGWALFYGAFVVMASIHGPIGLRNVLREWTDLTTGLINFVTAGFGFLLLFVGIRAVLAVTQTATQISG